MKTWLKKIIFRRYSNVPEHLKKIWITVWITLAISFTIAGIFSIILPLPGWAKTIITLFGGGLLSAFIASVGSFIKNSFLTSLGDVACYMTPEPDNIGERSNIRQITYD